MEHVVMVVEHGWILFGEVSDPGAGKEKANKDGACSSKQARNLWIIFDADLTHSAP